MRFSGPVLAASLMLLAGYTAEAPAAGPDRELQPAATSEKRYGPLDAVPASVLGRWKLTSQECEKEGDPSPRLGQVSVTFFEDFSYEMVVEGWRFPGRFKVERFIGTPLRIQLNETYYEFDVEDGRLENWSEGEAVYLCGNIFTRDEL